MNHWRSFIWIFFTGNLYRYCLLRCSFSTSLFSFFKVFQQNAFLFFWITKFFLFGVCPTFFFNSIKVVVTPFLFVVIGLEQPGVVTKCDDCLIFSANECFMLPYLLIYCCSHVHLITYDGLDEVGCWTYH